MYKKVETKKEREIFQSIYREICQTEQFTLDTSSEKAVQYLFYHQQTPVGVIELAPYEPHIFTTVCDFDFTQIPLIQNKLSVVWEADKLGVLKNYRSVGFMKDILALLYSSQKEYQYEYGIALLEERFYYVMKRFFKSNILTVGEPLLVEGEKSRVVPTVIDALSCVDWYNETFLKLQKQKS